jgi:hypothetical protein
MMRAVEEYFLRREEPVKSCMLALRQLILDFDPGITEEWKYGMPFYYCHGKMFCYLWIHKKHRQPYIGVVEGQQIVHPRLLPEKRARMAILLVDPETDIPVADVRDILAQAITFYPRSV